MHYKNVFSPKCNNHTGQQAETLQTSGGYQRD